MAKLSWNRQLGLAAALFVLGSAAYWLEFKHKPQKEAAQEQAKHLFQIKENPVQSITIQNGKSTVVLSCLDMAAKLCKPGDNSKWQITQPMQVKADDANVNSLLSSLNTLNSAETIELKDEPSEKRSALIKEYGLDVETRKSNQRIEVVTQGGKTTLDLGLPHPIGENTFALENGKEDVIYLVPNHFKTNTEHDLTYWRDKKLLTVAAHEIESFTLKDSKGEVSASKKEGKWLLHTGADELSGDIENIDSFLSSAAFLAAKNFVSDNKTDEKAKDALKGLSPAIVLKLQKEKGSAKELPEPMTLTLFQKKSDKPAENKIYATVSNLDPLFELDPGSVNRLNKSAKDLRLTKLITAMERFSAARIEFSGQPMGEKPIVINKKDGKWLRDSDQTEVPSDKINTFLEKLSGNRIQEFLAGSAIVPGEKDGLKVSLGDNHSPTLKQFVFWRKNEKLYARDLQSKRNEAYLIDSSMMTSIPWNVAFFQKPAPSEKSDPKQPSKTDSKPDLDLDSLDKDLDKDSDED